MPTKTNKSLAKADNFSDMIGNLYTSSTNSHGLWANELIAPNIDSKTIECYPGDVFIIVDVKPSALYHWNKRQYKGTVVKLYNLTRNFSGYKAYSETLITVEDLKSILQLKEF